MLYFLNVLRQFFVYKSRGCIPAAVVPNSTKIQVHKNSYFCQFCASLPFYFPFKVWMQHPALGWVEISLYLPILCLVGFHSFCSGFISSWPFDSRGLTDFFKRMSKTFLNVKSPYKLQIRVMKAICIPVCFVFRIHFWKLM